jgi:hypothetical protein
LGVKGWFKGGSPGVFGGFGTVLVQVSAVLGNVLPLPHGVGVGSIDFLSAVIVNMIVRTFAKG